MRKYQVAVWKFRSVYIEIIYNLRNKTVLYLKYNRING